MNGIEVRRFGAATAPASKPATPAVQLNPTQVRILNKYKSGLKGNFDSSTGKFDPAPEDTEYIAGLLDNPKVTPGFRATLATLVKKLGGDVPDAETKPSSPAAKLSSTQWSVLDTLVKWQGQAPFEGEYVPRKVFNPTQADLDRIAKAADDYAAEWGDATLTPTSLRSLLKKYNYKPSPAAQKQSSAPAIDLDAPAAELTPVPTSAPEPWNDPEAKAELVDLQAKMAEINRLDSRADQWATNTGEAKGYGGGYTWKMERSYEFSKQARALRDEYKPLNEAWLKKYGPPEPKKGVKFDQHWDQLEEIRTSKVGSLDPDTRQKIRDMYVVPDEKTLAKQRDLRSGNPSPAAKTWRGKVSRMVNNEATREDALVYRTAAFSPAMAASLVPGSSFVDDAFMSTGSDTGSSFMYAAGRVGAQAGVVQVNFHLQVPKGTPAADVDYGEVVLDYGNTIEILDVGMVDGVRTVVARVKHRRA